MIGRILFMSAAAFVAYRYISRSNKNVQKELTEARGTVQILPPEKSDSVILSEATDNGRAARTAPRLSPAAEDFSRR